MSEMNELGELDSIYASSYPPGVEVVAGDVNAPAKKKKNQKFIQAILQGIAGEYGADGQAAYGHGYPEAERIVPDNSYGMLGSALGTLGKRIVGAFRDGGIVYMPGVGLENPDEDAEEDSEDTEAPEDPAAIPQETPEDELTYTRPDQDIDPENTAVMQEGESIKVGEGGEELVTRQGNRLVIEPLRLRQFQPVSHPPASNNRMNEYLGAVDRMATYKPKEPGILRRIAAGLMGAGAGYLSSSGTPATQQAGAMLTPIAMRAARGLLNGRNERELEQLRREVQARGVSAQIETQGNAATARAVRDQNTAQGKAVELYNKGVAEEAAGRVRGFNANVNAQRADNETKRLNRPIPLNLTPGSRRLLIDPKTNKEVGRFEGPPVPPPRPSWDSVTREGDNQRVHINRDTGEVRETGVRARVTDNSINRIATGERVERSRAEDAIRKLAGRAIDAATDKTGKINAEQAIQGAKKIENEDIRGLVLQEVQEQIKKLAPKKDDAMEFLNNIFSGGVSGTTTTPASATPTAPATPTTPAKKGVKLKDGSIIW